MVSRAGGPAGSHSAQRTQMELAELTSLTTARIT
jgi:hypothetical protein